MTNTQVTYLVAACSGVFALAAYVGLILVPAWSSYTRLRERLAAAFLSVYVLAGFVAIGSVAGLAIVWFWDEYGIGGT